MIVQIGYALEIIQDRSLKVREDCQIPDIIQLYFSSTYFMKECTQNANCYYTPSNKLIVGAIVLNSGVRQKLRIPTGNLSQQYRQILIYYRIQALEQDIKNNFFLEFRHQNYTFNRIATIQQGDFSAFQCLNIKATSKRVIMKFEDIMFSGDTEEIILGMAELIGTQYKSGYITRYGIATNCVNNCLLCSDKYNCSQCMPSFQLITLNSYQICEQVDDCKIGHCFSCAQLYDKSLETCLRCLPGFILNQNQCKKIHVAPPCPSSQYASEIDGSCIDYSSKCFFQDEESKTFNICTNELSSYKCKQDNVIVIFDYLIGDVYNCVEKSSLINYCIKFSDYNVCIQCEQNYQYDDITQSCIKHQCLVGQYKNTVTGNCETCSQYCASCTQQMCNSCIDQTYVVDQNNPQTCIPCQIPNCTSCNSTDGTCEVCQDGYFKKDDHTGCLECQAENCVKCNQIGPYVCETCVNNYILFPETKQCVCSVENCFKCETNDGALCKQCISNYKLTNSLQCEPVCMVNNCTQCDENNNQKCKICQDNFQLTPLFQCIAICTVNNCNKCNDNNGQICQQCESNYNLNNQYQCDIICNISNCSLCKNNNTAQCQTCMDKYSLNDQFICIRNCEIPNCITCNEDGSVCHQCDTNYSLYQNTCISLCDIENCKTCEVGNNKICKQCLDNYYLNQNLQDQLIYQQTHLSSPDNNNQLQQQQICGLCQVQNCKECVWNSQEDCQKCNESYTYDKKNKLCVKLIITKENKMQFYEKTNNNGYEIQITLSQPLKIDSVSDLSTQIKVAISSINNVEFQINLDPSNQKIIYINAILNQNCKNEKLLIEFPDEYFQKNNNFLNKQYDYQLDTYVVVSEQQQAASQQAGQVNEGVSQSLLMTMITVVIFGNYYILINTIDITSFIYYLLYVNVRYPDNVLQFCSRFKNFQFPFIPNIFAFLVDPNYVVPSPKKFMENDSDSYFLKNGGQSLTICLGVTLVYTLTKLLSRFIPWRKFKQYFERKIQERWELCALFDAIGTVYIYILVGVLLQFYSFDTSDPMRSSYLNYTMFCVCLVFVIYYPIYLIRLINSTKHLSKNEFFLVKYNSIVGGLKLYEKDAIKQFKKSQIGKINFQSCSDVFEFKRKMFEIELSAHCVGIGYIRKFIFCLVIVYFHFSPAIQLMILIIINLSMSFYYFHVRPYLNCFDNIKNGICELLLICFEICLMFLIDDQPDQSEDDRFLIGWIIVGACSLMIGIHAITMIIELIQIFQYIIVKFVFGICIQQYKKLHQGSSYSPKQKRQKKIPSSQTNTNYFNKQNNILSGIEICSLEELKVKNLSTKKDSQLKLSQQNSNYYNNNNFNNNDATTFQDSPQLQQTTIKNNHKYSSYFLKDDMPNKNQSDSNKGSQMSHLESNYEATIFSKNKKQLGQNHSSTNFYDQTLFSSMHQEKGLEQYKNTDKESHISSNQGEIYSKIVELNQKQSSNTDQK